MTATMATKTRKSSEPALLAPIQSPRCELLFELFVGELGRVQLGRMLSGTDAGRLVTLRQLSAPPSAALTQAVNVARTLSSPRLKKTLGTLRVEGSWYLASEYLSGVAMSELTHSLNDTGERVDIAAAICITLDTLSATIAARNLLETTSNAASVRCLHLETVWLADFGETFLSEVPAGSALADETGARSGLRALENAEAEDVRTAGHLLLELATGSLGASALEDPELPPSVREIVARATRRSDAPPFASLHEFAEALSALDSNLIATDEEVSFELARLMGSVLELRRQKVTMTERAALGEGEQDETKFFNATSVPAQSETARPPPETKRAPLTEAKAPLAEARPPLSAARTPLKEVSPNAHRIAPRSEPPDQPTMIFKRPDLIIETIPEIAEVEADAPSTKKPELIASAPTDVTAATTESASAKSTSTHGSLATAATAPSSIPVDFRQRFITPRRALVLLVLLLSLLAFAATTSQGAALTVSAAAWLHRQFPALVH